MKPKDTPYKGYWFRSRLEARWAVFFDTLGLKWLYEPEGFDLYFDYEDFAKDWDMSEEELLDEGIPQALQKLDGRVISYLPDFYLPELNYWIEIKSTRPNKAEVLKAFFLSHFVYKAARQKLDEARTDKEHDHAWKDLITGGVYIFYGEIPWPYPERGNAVGYGRTSAEGGTRFGPDRLFAHLGLCWQQCRICSTIDINSLGDTFCRGCIFALEEAIYSRTGMAEEMPEVVGEALWWAKGVAEALQGLELEYLLEPDLRDHDPLDPPDQEIEREKKIVERVKQIREVLGKHDSLVKEVLNLEFFTNGHKTPDLQNAYEAARSARFEHGETPRPSG